MKKDLFLNSLPKWSLPLKVRVLKSEAAVTIRNDT